MECAISDEIATQHLVRIFVNEDKGIKMCLDWSVIDVIAYHSLSLQFSILFMSGKKLVSSY